MELYLRGKIVAINPRRINCIECYKEDTLGNFRTNPYTQYEKDKRDDETKPNFPATLPKFKIPSHFDYFVEIHMTDGKKIVAQTDDVSMYEELRDELKEIVGGKIYSL